MAKFSIRLEHSHMQQAVQSSIGLHGAKSTAFTILDQVNRVRRRLNLIIVITEVHYF